MNQNQMFLQVYRIKNKDQKKQDYSTISLSLAENRITLMIKIELYQKILRNLRKTHVNYAN